MVMDKVDRWYCDSCKKEGACDFFASFLHNNRRYCREPALYAPKIFSNIKDSGQRTQFETGAVRDIHEGKGRYDLLPWEAVHELAIHCEQGAKKYGERNAELGIPIHSLIDSAIRHLSCYLRGMKDEPHLRAALWNVAFAIWTEKNKPEMQDIPARKE
jgi:tRNA-dihydrouridine synthase